MQQQQQQQQPQLHQLQQLLQQTLQPSLQGVQEAERELEALSKQEAFPQSLLMLLLNQQVDPAVHHAAAIYLKNYVRRMWDIDEAQGGVSAANRLLLKHQLLLLLQQQHVSRAVEAQLGEALSRVAATDFPLEWPDLLPALVQQQLQLPSPQQLQQLPQQQQQQLLHHVVRGLATLHVITKKYRQAMRSEEVLLQLQQILKHVQQPLLSVFTFSVLRLLAAADTAQQQQQQHQQGAAATAAVAAAPGEMEAALQATLLSSKVFLSLSSVDLPEFFEDNLSSYVLGFVRVLQLPIHPSSSNGDAAADDDDEGDGPGGLEHLKAVVCDALRLYAQKYQEELSPFVSLIVRAVWCAIRPLDSRVRFDLLLSSAAECLSAAAATNWERGPLPQDLAAAAAAFGLKQQEQQELQQQLQQSPANPFQDEALLRDIISGVILPSLPLRDKDVELFSDAPLDFVRRDVETASSCPHLPRRACVLDLIKGLCRLRQQQQQLQQMLLQLVQQLAAEAEAAGGGTTERGSRLLDSAAFVMSAVAAKARQQQFGAAAPAAAAAPSAAATPADLAAFFSTHLAKELQQQQQQQQQQQRAPLAVAAALKYLATFRRQLPPQLVLENLPLVSSFLLSPDLAVRAYASFCLERLLATKTQQGLKVVDTKAAQPILLKGNEFAVKLLVRLLLCLGSDAAAEGLLLLQPLLQQIQAAAAQPGNPVYSHYLFEALAAICRLPLQLPAAAASDQQQQQQQQQQVEAQVVPVMSVLIRQGQHEFTPYCFQILGVLLNGAWKTQTLGSNQVYVQLLDRLLESDLWVASQGNVPALVRLVSVFLRQQQQQQHQQLQQLIEQRITQLLERIQFCLFLRRLSNTGFDLLNALFRFVSFEVYRQQFSTLLTVLLKRAHQLQQKPFNAQLAFSLLLFQCRSPDVLLLPAALEQLQQGLLQQVVCCILLPSVRQTVEGGLSLPTRKVFTVGLARVAAAATAAGAPAAAAEPAMLQQVLETLEGLISGQAFEATGQLLPRRKQQQQQQQQQQNLKQQQQQQQQQQRMLRVCIGLQRLHVQRGEPRRSLNQMEDTGAQRAEFDVSYSRLALADTAPLTDYLDDLADVRGAVRVSLLPLSANIKQLAAQSGNTNSALLQLLA